MAIASPGWTQSLEKQQGEGSPGYHSKELASSSEHCQPARELAECDKLHGLAVLMAENPTFASGCGIDAGRQADRAKLVEESYQILKEFSEEELEASREISDKLHLKLSEKAP